MVDRAEYNDDIQGDNFRTTHPNFLVKGVINKKSWDNKFIEGGKFL